MMVSGSISGPSICMLSRCDNTMRMGFFYEIPRPIRVASLRISLFEPLCMARQRDFDVFNALNVMEHESFLKVLKLGIGDGFLQ